MGSKKILVINGHPNDKSLCYSITNELVNVLKKNENINAQLIHLSELKFDPILRFGYQQEYPLEPDLQGAQSLIKQADHIIFIYPSWWGMPPALLKGFIDRVFLPGFAFKYVEGSPIPSKLLKGKTSQLIITMDTPLWFYKYVIGALGVKIMVKSVLGFCGIKNKSTTYFSPIKTTTEQDRKAILEKVKTLAKEII